MIELTKQQQQEIIEHAKTAGEHEGCGILAGTRGQVSKIYKMKNVSDSPQTCYFMDPKEQLQVMKEIRNLGLIMLGVYHSHPTSPAYPSARDVELAFYPEALYVIVSLQNLADPEFRAFRIVEGKINEEKIVIK